MANKQFLGEFEQMILLTILQLKKNAYAPDATAELESSAGRTVTQGAPSTLVRGLDEILERDN